MSWFSDEHLHQLISTYGYGAVGAIVAMESMGLPAPGEIILIVSAMSTSNSALSQIEMTTIVFSAHTRRACPSFSIILREVGVRGLTMPSLFRFFILTRFGRERGLQWGIRTICGFE